MGIGEVSSINQSSYLGQGSSVKTAPSASAPAPVTPASAPVEHYESTNKNLTPQDASTSMVSKTDNEKTANEEGKKQATSSLRDAVSKINAAGQSCEAVFGIHEGTNRVMIKMVDKETKETVKEFPAEETLDLIAKAWELAGIMVDEKR